MNRCAVTPADGKTIYSRWLTVPSTGMRLQDADGMDGIKLPRNKNTVGYQLTLTVKPTVGAATPTYLLFEDNGPMDGPRTWATMANAGFGELLGPGDKAILNLSLEENRMILDLLGIESDFTTEASVVIHVHLKELIALIGEDCK